jgi:hypothetical protein
MEMQEQWDLLVGLCSDNPKLAMHELAGCEKVLCDMVASGAFFFSVTGLSLKLVNGEKYASTITGLLVSMGRIKPVGTWHEETVYRIFR